MFQSRFAKISILLAAGAVAVAATVPARFAQDPEAPNEHHKRITASAGEWTGTLTSYMPGMGEDPMEAHEVSEAVGGFWVQTRFECDIMGSPYIGSGCVGYDAKAKKYVGTWYDNQSSYFNLMEGSYDADKGAIVMRWDAPDMTGKMTKHGSETVHNGDSYTATFFTGENLENKIMKIEMTRKSAGAVDASADKGADKDADK